MRAKPMQIGAVIGGGVVSKKEVPSKILSSLCIVMEESPIRRAL